MATPDSIFIYQATLRIDGIASKFYQSI